MKTVAALGLLTLAFVRCLAVEGPAKSAPPAKLATAETSAVLFENERTRVIEYHTNTGTNICGLGMHSHPAHLYIMLTDAKLRIVTPGGKEEIVDAKSGEVGWEPAVTHMAENLLGNNAGCYLIEFKDKDWKPSTGLSP